MTVAYILINAELGKEKNVLEALKKTPLTKEAHLLLGSFDLLIKVEVENTKELREFITQTVRKVDGVTSTMTIIAV